MSFKIILKSGYVIDNVESLDSTKNPVGLWIWAKNQKVEQILSFKGANISSEDIAAILEPDKNNFNDNMPWGMGGNNNDKF